MQTKKKKKKGRFNPKVEQQLTNKAVETPTEKTPTNDDPSPKTTPEPVIDVVGRKKPGEEALQRGNGSLQSATAYLGKEAPSVTALGEKLSLLNTALTNKVFANKQAKSTQLEEALQKVEIAEPEVGTAVENVDQAMKAEKLRRENRVAELAKQGMEEEEKTAQSLPQALAYLPKDAAAIKTYDLAQGTLKKDQQTLAQAVDQGTPGEFDQVAQTVASDVTGLGNAATDLVGKAVAEERQRREQEVEKLTKDAEQATKNSENVAKGIFPQGALAGYEKQVEEYQQAVKAVSEKKNALLDAPQEQFASAFGGAQTKVSAFASGYAKAFSVEKERREKAMKGKQDAVENQQQAFDQLLQKAKDVWPQPQACPLVGDFADKKKEALLYIDGGKKPRTAESFDKLIDGFDEKQRKPLSDLVAFAGTEAEALRKIPGLKKTVEQKKKTAVERVKSAQKSSQGVEDDFKERQKVVDELLKGGKKNAEAFEQLKAMEKAGGDWEQEVSNYRGAVQDAKSTAKSLGTFPQVASTLNKMTQEVESAEWGDLTKIQSVVGDLRTYVNAAKELVEEFNQASASYSKNHSLLKYDEVQEAKFTKAFKELKEFKPNKGDLTFQTARAKIKDFENLVQQCDQEVKDYEKLLEPVQKKLELLEKSLDEGPVTKELKERFSAARGSAKQNGFATAAKALEKIDASFDAAQQFADALPSVREALSKVPESTYGNLATDADIFFKEKFRTIQEQLIKSWNASVATQQLQETRTALENYALLDAALQNTKKDFLATTSNRSDPGANVVEAALKDVRDKANKNQFDAATAGVETLSRVAKAVSSFQDALKTAQSNCDKAKNQLTDGDFASAVKTADALLRDARRPGDENKAFETGPYETSKKNLGALAPVYKAMGAVAQPYLDARTACQALKHPGLAKVRKNLEALLAAAYKPAGENATADAKPYTEVKDALTKLNQMLPSVGEYAATFLGVTKQFDHVMGLSPVEMGDPMAIGFAMTDGELDDEYKKAIKLANDNTSVAAGPYQTAKKDLEILQKELVSVIKYRHDEVQKAVTDEMASNPDLKAITGHILAAGGTGQAEANQFVVADLFKTFGMAGLKKLLKEFDVDPTDVTKQGAAKHVAALQSSVGGKGIQTLSSQLGASGDGSSNLSKLIDPKDNAPTKLLADLHEQFQEAPEELGDLMQKGFANKGKEFASVVKTACGKDAKNVKKLVDAFGGADAGQRTTEMAKLSQMIDADDRDDDDNPKCGKRFKTLLDERFGGDFAKLNTVLYKKTADAFPTEPESRKKLWKGAANFKTQPTDTKLLDGNDIDGKGTSEVRIEHFLKRHVPKHFDFGDVKAEQSEWPTKVTKTELTNILNTAIDRISQVKTIDNNWNDGDYKVRDYTIGGYRVRVGIQKFKEQTRPKIDQFYPLANDDNAHDPDEEVVNYLEKEMNTMNEILKG